MKVENLSVLSEQLLDHIIGGTTAEEFTCVYDRETKRQYSAVDDSNGNIVHAIEK